MKSIKQIRENYNLVVEKEEADIKKLTALGRAGLFDMKKINFIKRALEKDPKEMTLAERKILIQLLEELMSQVLHSSQVYTKVKQNVMQGDIREEVLDETNLTKDRLSKADDRFPMSWPSEKDMPIVIILKRKSVRVFPDRQKVGLYYSQALDRYFSIPFSGGPSAGLAEDYKQPIKVVYGDDEETTSNKKTAPVNRYNKYSRDRNTTNRIGRIRKAVQKVGALNIKPGELKAKSGDSFLKRYKKSIRADEVKKGVDSAIQSTSGAERAALIGWKFANRKALKGPGVNLNSAPDKKASAPLSTSGSTTGKMQSPMKPMIKESFRDKLNHKRQNIDEGVWDTVKDTASSLVPGVDAYKSFKQGDYLGAAGNLALDAAAIGAGALTGGLGAAAVKGLATGAKALKTGRTVSQAAKIGTRVAKNSTGAKIAGSIARGAGRLARGAGRLAAGVAGAALAGGSKDNSSSGTSEVKYSQAKEFSGKGPTVSRGGQDTRTSDAVSIRKQAKADRSYGLTENIIRNIKNVSEETTFIIGEQNIVINKNIAEKIVSLYESVNKQNKKKIESMLGESVESFKKIVEFAVRQ